eukprot:6471598-Amphidinium_carterae.2
MLLTRPVSYIIIEVPSVKVSPLETKQPSVRNIDGREEKESLKPGRSNWQLDRLPLRCANRYSLLEREQAEDDEVWYSDSSAVEEGRKQVATCSRGGIFGVPEQLSKSPSDQKSPGQSIPKRVLCNNTAAVMGQVGFCSAGNVLGGTHRRSGGGRPSSFAEWTEWTRSCQKRIYLMTSSG